MRPHGGALGGPPHEQYLFWSVDAGFELWVSDDLPLPRFAWTGEQTTFHMDAAQFINLRIIRWHWRGTDFGIGADPADALLRQAPAGYQLKWVDAKAEGWVVTPRPRICAYCRGSPHPDP